MTRKRDSDHTATTRIGPAVESPAESIRNRAYLIVLTGTNVGKMYRLVGKDETVIGRSSKAHVRLDDDRVSRNHARIRVIDDALVIEDLRSQNGMSINGQKVKQHALKDGDKIRLGETTVLKFTYTDQLDESFQKHMYDAALRDSLTSTFNKAFFSQRIEAECAYARRHKTNLALLMLDVDHFKRVNDVYGHPAGDRVLVNVAKAITAAVRLEDVLARYGGEEFAIICRGIELKNAVVLAERVRRKIEDLSILHEGTRIKITASLGAAAYPELPVESGQELVALADEALLRGKRQGRNRVVVATV